MMMTGLCTDSERSISSGTFSNHGFLLVSVLLLPLARGLGFRNQERRPGAQSTEPPLVIRLIRSNNHPENRLAQEGKGMGGISQFSNVYLF